MAKRIPALAILLNFFGSWEKPPFIVRGGTEERVLLARSICLWGRLNGLWGRLSACLLSSPHPVRRREPSQTPVAGPQEHHHSADQSHLSPWQHYPLSF